MTASHQERRTTHFLKELGWRGNKNSMSSPTTFDKYTTQVTAVVYIKYVKKDHFSYFQMQVKIYLVQKIQFFFYK